MSGEMIYVAVGKEVESRNSTLKWALKRAKKENSPCICVFYVLAPSQMIDLPNGFKAPVHSMEEYKVESYREREKQEVVKILNDCGTMCNTYKVPFQTLQIKSESITAGIIELIGQLGIQKLVMGAAANSTYSRKMSTATSKKANYVLRCAPDFCQIWFVCNNRLISTREGQGRQRIENHERNKLEGSGNPGFLLNSRPRESAGGSSSSSPSMHHGYSPTSIMPPNVIDQLYAKLQQSQKESKESAEIVLREVKQRQDAEKVASEANIKVKEAEKNLIKIVEKLRDTEIKLEDTLHGLGDASSQLTSLKSENKKQCLKVKELRRKLESSENSQKMYKKLCDNLQKKLNNALLVDQGSANYIALEQLSLDAPIFSCKFSMVDLEEATNSFDPSLKIGEGWYANVYRGFLNHTDVAIKKLNPNSLQGPSEFKQEVDVLSKLRHPNIVTLLGTCNELRSLIYEYLPNGTLEDRLLCKDNTPPLPWQTRIQIATDLCSVLIFLHSRQPNSIIHAHINPENVLLDANFICKLSGFGSCHVISNEEDGVTGKTHVTPKTDVYSFGMILLCLLTAEDSSEIAKKVQYALEIDDFYNILDHSAGEWPFVRATQLAHLALRCWNMSSDDCPDLASEVWMVLKPTNDPSQSLSKPLQIVREERIPSYFICPILQEIMHDPHFAADGYTYEANAIKTWYEGGHETSPMTNLRLANLHLTPNHALHSAIQEWRQKHQCV